MCTQRSHCAASERARARARVCAHPPLCAGAYRPASVAASRGWAARTAARASRRVAPWIRCVLCHKVPQKRRALRSRIGGGRWRSSALSLSLSVLSPSSGARDFVPPLVLEPATLPDGAPCPHQSSQCRRRVRRRSSRSKHLFSCLAAPADREMPRQLAQLWPCGAIPGAGTDARNPGFLNRKRQQVQVVPRELPVIQQLYKLSIRPWGEDETRCPWPVVLRASSRAYRQKQRITSGSCPYPAWCHGKRPESRKEGSPPAHTISSKDHNAPIQPAQQRS